MPSDACEAGESPPIDFDAFIRDRWDMLVASFNHAYAHGLDAQDIAQEALIIVAGRYADRYFANDGMLYAYARTIGHNMILRAMGTKPPKRLRHLRHEVTASEPERHVPDAGGPDAGSLAVQNVDLARAFDALPLEYRRVLTLAGDGFDGPTIAEILGLSSPEAARKLLARARLAAREGLAPGGAIILPFWSRSRSPGHPFETAAHVLSPAGTATCAALAFSLVSVLSGPHGRAVPAVPYVSVPTVAPARTAGNEPEAAAAPSPRPGRAPARPETPTGRRGADSVAAGRGDVPRTNVPRVPRVLPTCVGVCSVRPEEGWRGDRIDVPALGEDAPYVEQFVTPGCRYVPTNPGARCRSGEEPDDYIVKDVPPVPDSPGGTSP